MQCMINHILCSTEYAYTGLNGSIMEDVSSFLPDPDLQRPAADVNLIFLSANNIAFIEPINDNWYSAHLSTVSKNVPDGGRITPSNVSYYYRDDPVRVLGCTSQYQFCNPVLEPNNSCTPLTGILAMQTLAESLWQNDKGKALTTWAAQAILEDAIGLPEVIVQLGVSSLTSRYKLATGIQAFLPDDQWQLEVEHWFTATLADLQRAIVETATGPTDAEINRWLKRPQTPEEHLLCRSQVSSLSCFISDHLLIL